MARTFAEILKDSPDVGDVHIRGGKARRGRLRSRTRVKENAEDDLKKADVAEKLVRHHKHTARLHEEMGRHIHTGGLLIGMLPQAQVPTPPSPPPDTPPQTPVAMRDAGTVGVFKAVEVLPEKQMIFGWASVVTKDGKLIVDKQGDIIEPHVLEDAAYDFVLEARAHGHMHQTIGTGDMVESMVFTAEKQKALGINLGQEGWFVGFKVQSPEVWEAYRRGELPEFSIGGLALSENYDG